MIDWHVRRGSGWSLIEFTLPRPLGPDDLAQVRLPNEVTGRTNEGLIISGRGPVWLYAHLTHLAHIFPWVATYEPRLHGGVVVESHVSQGPEVGDVIEVPADSVSGSAPSADAPTGTESAPGRTSSIGTACRCQPSSPRPDRTFRYALATQERTWRAGVLLTAFLLSSILVLVAGHWASLAIWESLTRGQVPRELVGAAIALVVFFLAACLLYHRRFHRQVGFAVVSIYASALILILAGHVLAFAVHGFAHRAHLPVLLPIAVLIGGVLGLHGTRRALAGVKTLVTRAWDPGGKRLIVPHPGSLRADGSSDANRSEKHPAWPTVKHLVLPVSVPNWRPCWVSTQEGSVPVFIRKDGSEMRLEGHSLADVIKRYGTLEEPRPNWQHMLRAVEPHQATLETVWLVGSAGEADSLGPYELDQRAPPGGIVSKPDALGSMAFLPDAARLLRMCLPHVRIWEPGRRSDAVPFSDVSALQNAVASISNQIRREFKASTEDILIDTTGGQKTTSIAAAMNTLNSLGMFQYVDTREPHHVYCFDQRIEAPPELV